MLCVQTECFAVESRERLDVLIARHLSVTRSFAQRLVREGRVALAPSGKPKPSFKPAPGTVVSVSAPPPETLEIEPQDVPFKVVYEDVCLLVVDKPAGLVVHPSPGHWRGTLVHGLLFRYPDIRAFGLLNNVARPGIVHRLDVGTSGLMVVARDQKTMTELQRAFKERAVVKKYLALAQGEFNEAKGLFKDPIGRCPANRLRMAVVEGGRPAATEYRVLWSRGGYSLVVCGLLTGRTHQIRVHMAAAGRPLAGDTLYGAKKIEGFERVFLHSWQLAFVHPATGQPLSFRSPLSEELRHVLQRVKFTRLPS